MLRKHLYSPHGVRRMGMRRLRALALLPLLAAVPACGDDGTQPAETRTFTIDVQGEQFRVRVASAAQIDALEERMEHNTTGALNGELRAGDGGFNAPWSWHLDPASIEVPDVTIELCDGTPSMVEADVAGWIQTVGRYCPWGARVVAETGAEMET